VYKRQGRVAVHEILLRTQGLPNVIREGNTPMLQSIIQGNRKIGMCAMDDSIEDKLEKGLITAHDAWSKAADKNRFEAAKRKEEAAAAQA